MSEQDSGNIEWNVYDFTTFASDFCSRVNVMTADFYTLAERLGVAVSQVNHLSDDGNPPDFMKRITSLCVLAAANGENFYASYLGTVAALPGRIVIGSAFSYSQSKYRVEYLAAIRELNGGKRKQKARELDSQACTDNT